MKTKGMKHQLTALERSDGKRNFAYLMEQGTGKTWTTMADAERAFLAGKIDAIAVVAPNGVNVNWVKREIPTHMEVATNCYVWRGNPTSKVAKAAYEKLFANHYCAGEAPLRVFSINVEAVNTKNGYAALERFLTAYRCMMVVDESTRIKNPAAKRTEKIIDLGKLAIARRILTGTPLTKAPTDLFSQFDFLKSGLLGTKSYRAFVAEYATLLSPNHPQMIAMISQNPRAAYAQVVATDEFGNKMWRNLDRLASLIEPHSYRVRKEDCLDLPPKVYKTVFFDLDPVQRAKYDELKTDYSYEDLHGDVNSFIAIAARTKMKQVTSGFINIEGERQLIEPGSNPRMEAFKDVVEDIEGQFIVWAMFEEEIIQIEAALAEAGISSVKYYGATSKGEREDAIDDFQRGEYRSFIANAQAAGIGLTLTAASTAVYYSCSYDNELRMQSEDRNHRIGTKNSVLYIDLVAEDTLDEDIMKSLATKSALASFIIDGKR